MNKSAGNSYGAARLGLCLAAVLGVANSSHGSGVEAGQLEKFELNIVETTIGADEILAGDLAGGIETIQSRPSLNSEYARATNLCAAFTARGAFANAKEHCRDALHLSRSDRYEKSIGTSVYVSNRSRQATAFNNLGVWHALQGNTEQAREYFEAARKKGKHVSSAGRRNIDSLEQREDSNVAVAS